MNEKTNPELREKIVRNESLSLWGGWLVVGGLVIEVLLTIAFRNKGSLISTWGPTFADSLVALGVYGEIYFGRKSAEAHEILQRQSDENIAELNLRTEELRKINLELQKSVRGREITDQQRDRVVDAVKGKPIPELITFIARDPEARMYGLSIIDLLQEIGMKGKAVLLEDPPPMQTGVMYCGKGTEEDVLRSRILMDAGIVTLGNPSGKWGNSGGTLPYCPPGSVFVGQRPPLAEIRSHKLKE